MVRKISIKFLLVLSLLLFNFTCISCSFDLNFLTKAEYHEVTYPSFLDERHVGRNYKYPSEYLINWNLEKRIYESNNTLSLYKFVTEDLKYIVGYTDKKPYNRKYIKWYEYSDINKKKNEIDELVPIYYYVVIEGKLKYDYLKACNLDFPIKYFYQFSSRYYSAVNEMAKFDLQDEYLMWAPNIADIEKEIINYNTDFCPIINNVLREIFPIINQDGKQYMKTPIRVENLVDGHCSNVTISDFGNLYDQLNNYLIKDTEMYTDLYNNKNRVYYGLLEINGLLNVINEYKRGDDSNEKNI